MVMLTKPDELVCCKDTGQGKQLRKYVVLRISSFGWGEDVLHGNRHGNSQEFLRFVHSTCTIRALEILVQIVHASMRCYVGICACVLWTAINL